ncbi:hypothetical protein GPECTOR_57g453 [Gonium pectorale]|uniref:peptidylprolyl isomerase n=1 Tax=Gonium pectorale TaxID=33097 RepID=A0A150G5W9_GONPE|nr:hypothetical protein GPECTOR_57g453 [Gonium pectorale]|eukprot:KXZ45163.1 hypothetical protein GPECTOR_57g453 [Gonium pectorale]
MAEDINTANEVVDATMDETAADLAPAVNDAMEDDLDFGDAPGKEEKLTDDGGVIKKIITPGEGWESPEAGDEVTVHYVGTLEDGTQFDSSRDRDEPFVFPLGQGRVIKGWDTGVAKMKKGEKSLLICKPEYAYGAQGSPPKIPPNATLNFEVELISWRSIKDISGDGGVIKTVVAEGSGWQECKELFEAKVAYTARVAGAEAPFASSDETVFTVSEGHLVPAVKVALKTMKKGEKVHLKVKPAYGFGEAGSEAYGVPPNAELEIDLTLTGWHHVENVNPEGTVVKKTLVSDENEYRTPNEGSKVTVRLTGKLLSDGTVFVRHEEGSELVFTTGEEQVPEGLEEAVMKMKKGERALITVTDPALGYGEAEHAGPLAAVPAGSGLQYEVELVAFENSKESWEMSDAEKVQAAKARKEKGNAYYKAGKLAKAQQYWDKAVSVVQYDKSFPEDAKQAAREVKRSCWLNLAAMDIKKQHWKDALRHCNNVLDIDSQNVKALYRRAQARMGLQELVEAETDIKNALYVEPNNADLLVLQKRLKVAMKEQNKKEASLYSKMFKFPASSKPAPPAAPAAAEVVPDAPAAADNAPAEPVPAPPAEAATVVPAEAEAMAA